MHHTDMYIWAQKCCPTIDMAPALVRLYILLLGFVNDPVMIQFKKQSKTS